MSAVVPALDAVVVAAAAAMTGATAAVPALDSAAAAVSTGDEVATAATERSNNDLVAVVVEAARCFAHSEKPQMLVFAGADLAGH